MSLESWKSFAESTGAISGVIAAAAVVVALILSNKVNRIQREETKLRDQKFQDQIGAQQLLTQEAQRKTEELRNENLKLEIELSPRTIRDQGAIARELAKSGSMNVEIEFLPDRECRNTALDIDTAVKLSGWRVLKFRELPDNPIDSFVDNQGVQVLAGRVNEHSAEIYKRAAGAADSLIAALIKTNIKAVRIDPPRGMTPGIIIIHVGMKPNPITERQMRERENAEPHNP